MNNIQLSPTEEKIFSLLKEVIKEKAPQTVLRVCGGWVRDHILGINSNDIDIAVNNMTGEQFANLVQEYLIEHGQKSEKISVVKANPAQSKHLATAMLKLFGLPIDFVNLRTETYSDSRIPTMTFGTPEEDAQRRDLTINSLFYNINTEQIEDFVGGLQDLQNHIAKTPMDPIKTFLDDPLRILRTVRFASKYGLKLSPDLIEAAKRPDVRDAFANKLSQERIWTELAGKKEGEKYKPGALIGSNPTQAIQLLKELGLIDLIFDPTKEDLLSIGLEDEMVSWDTEQNNPHHEFSIWDHTLKTVESLVNQTKATISENKEDFLVRNLAALLHDIGKRYKGIHGTHEKGWTTYHGHEEVSAKIAEKILQKLTCPNNIIKRVVELIDRHLSPHTLLENGNGKSYRRFVRDFPDWQHSIDLAIADNLGKQKYTTEEVPSEISKYEDLRNRINQAMPTGITKGTNIQRPINGKDLLELGFMPGPIMGKILSAIDEKLLENPELTKEEALDIAKSFR